VITIVRRAGVAALAMASLIAFACSSDATPEPATVAPPLTAPAQTPLTSIDSTASRPSREPVFLEGDFTYMEQQIANFLASEFPRLDLTRRTIPIRELGSGGVGVDDGIPSIQDPHFIAASEAESWLAPREPVIALAVGTEARIYPIQILIWHEMVSDTLDGIPVVATFCPLCNTALAFDRRINGQVHHFGVSGLLRESDLVMYDMETQSLWQQATGEAIVGTLAGTRLTFLPAHLISFEEARHAFPDALVLSRETGFRRDYGQNPYGGYDRIDSAFLAPTSFDDDGRLPAKARVLAVEFNDDPVAIGFDTLAQRHVIHFESGGIPVVAFWQSGTTTALDVPRIADAREVGSATAFHPRLNGEFIEFEARTGAIFDTATGSRWSVAGVAGPLEGARLEPVVSGNHFWFAWSVFKPHTRVLR